MTREEAINEIKSWDFLEGKEIEAIQTLIPELRKSEDERIRKEIIDFIQWAEDRGMTRHDYHQAKRPAVWIAYLEKQKETANSFTDGVIEVRSFQRGIAEGRRLERQKECVADSSKTSANEDESIRKFLVDYFTSYKIGNVATKLNGVRIDDILNYLEKQKEPEDVSASTMIPSCWEVEQKPAELDSLAKPMTHKEWAEDYWEHHKFASPNGNDKCDVIQFGHKGFIDFCIAYCVDQKPQDRLVLHDTFGYEKGRQVGQSEGVKMVLKTPESYGLYKPAEWSEEDEEMLNSCISSIEESKENRYAYKENDGDTSYDHEIAWLKSLPERFNLQSKQEQNDYITPHKEFFKFIYDRLINVHKENPNVDYMRSFKERINNLSFGEKQDWSEEDEIYLQDALWCVEKAEKSCKDEEDKGACWSAKRWLKSLRPSWKPSENQMSMLLAVVNDPNNAGSASCHLSLESLYNDLKKL